MQIRETVATFTPPEVSKATGARHMAVIERRGQIKE